MKMQKTQQGFTLIELMIVIAIVGILAAIALPAYQNYIIRSKMAEPMAALAEAKTSVAEYVATKGRFPRDGAVENFGLKTHDRSEDESEIFQAIEVAEDGNRIRIGAIVRDCVIDGGDDCSTIVNYSFHLSGSTNAGGMTWDCVPNSVTGDRAIDLKYLPSSCAD